MLYYTYCWIWRVYNAYASGFVGFSILYQVHVILLLLHIIHFARACDVRWVGNADEEMKYYVHVDI